MRSHHYCLHGCPRRLASASGVGSLGWVPNRERPLSLFRSGRRDTCRSDCAPTSCCPPLPLRSGCCACRPPQARRLGQARAGSWHFLSSGTPGSTAASTRSGVPESRCTCRSLPRGSCVCVSPAASGPRGSAAACGCRLLYRIRTCPSYSSTSFQLQSLPL